MARNLQAWFHLHANYVVIPTNPINFVNCFTFVIHSSTTWKEDRHTSNTYSASDLCPPHPPSLTVTLVNI